MIPRRILAAATAFFCAAVAAGCGLGPGDDTGEAGLLVTRDYGAEEKIDESVNLRESDTVLRVLDSEADVGTRYGGKFVHSVDGLEGSEGGGRRRDWFFYINGVESPVGAADVKPTGGQRIWWDYHDWSTAMRVPAVVGSFPEPFAHGFEGGTFETRIDCLGAAAPCGAVQSELKKEGVEAGIFDAEHAPGYDGESAPTLRILVGPWSAVGDDPAASQIEKGPATSGVFARYEGPRDQLTGLDDHGRPRPLPEGDRGLIAAVRFEAHPPTWVVTGAGPADVAAAARGFTADGLSGHYAVIVAGDSIVPLPLAVGGGR